DASNNKVLDVSTDGLRVLNGADTLMVISTQGIKAYIQPDAKDKALSRTFTVATSTSKGGENKVFEIATNEGATFYNPSDNSDKIFSISKTGITANVNPALNRDFEINDQVSQKGSGNLMKISNEQVFEVVNDSTMLWYKDKNAFRIGYVLITDPQLVGQGSFASGYRSQASGQYSSSIGYLANASGKNSFASGSQSLATGVNSFAIGTEAEATGSSSFAVGNKTEAIGSNACAMGTLTDATGTYSTSMGLSTIASGSYSTATGYLTQATGSGSSSFGVMTKATGTNSASMGYYSTAQAYGSFVIGRYNDIAGTQTVWVSTDPLFVVGNGTSTSDTSNAFMIRKNGVVLIPSLPTTVLGTSTYIKVDSSGKIGVGAKGDKDFPGSEEIESLKEENKKLIDKIDLQEQRIAKLEEMIEKLLK
ncbi:MAG: hypothetical protein KKD38_03955, partial [Candidatus Delongbacteria bacterium]|nr:hypothetical protein [Candidatus Delongbacteria bacterium]